MDDNTTYQIVQHTYAAIMWLYRYIDQHNLTFEEQDRVDILDFHINRIDALLAETECPIANDPTKRIVTELKRKRPNGEATLPGVTIFISKCYQG